MSELDGEKFAEQQYNPSPVFYGQDKKTRNPNVVTPENQTLQYKVVSQCICRSHVPVNKDSKELNLSR